MKKCSVCAAFKPLDNFYAQPGVKDGRQNKCKECARKAVQANRERNQEYYRKYDKMRYQRDPHRREANKAYAQTDRGKEASAKARLRFLEMSPEKRAAHILLGNAVRSGKVIKPSTCSKCGSTPRRRDLHGHHEDYTKPLDVEWICVLCHAAEHFPEAQSYREMFHASPSNPQA